MNTGNKLLTVIATVTILFAFNLKTDARPLAGLSGSFLRIGISADRVAMGDVGAALPGGGSTWYYNPAILPLEMNRQASLGYRWMSLDRSIIYASFSTNLEPNAGISFTVLRSGTDNIDGRYSNGEQFDVLSQSDNMISGSFGLNPIKQISIGITIKWYINAVPDILDDDKNLYAYGMGVDLGAMYLVTDWLNLGFQLKDIDSRYTWETSEVWGDSKGATEDQFPNFMRFGIGINALPDLSVGIDAILYPNELDDDKGVDVHYGLEYKYPMMIGRSFKLRTGWNGEAATFGFGIDLNLNYLDAAIDYAYIIEPNSPGDSHLIGWIFRF